MRHARGRAAVALGAGLGIATAAAVAPLGCAHGRQRAPILLALADPATVARAVAARPEVGARLLAFRQRPVTDVHVLRLAAPPDAALGEGRRVTFEVAPGRRVVAVGRRTNRRAGRLAGWDGEVPGPGDVSGRSATVTVDPDGLSASLSTGADPRADSYVIEPLGGGLHAVGRFERVPRGLRLQVASYWPAIGGTADSLVLPLGTEVRLEAVVLTAAGRPSGVLEGPFVSSDTNVLAVVTGTNAVRARRPGRAVVSVWTGPDFGDVRDSLPVRVPPPAGVYATLAAGGGVVELTGHYDEGFEAAYFAPCEAPAERWWVATLDSVPRVRAALDAAPNVPADPRFPAGPWRGKRVAVRWRGVVSDTGQYGHLGAARREFTPLAVRDVRPADSTSTCPVARPAGSE